MVFSFSTTFFAAAASCAMPQVQGGAESWDWEKKVKSRTFTGSSTVPSYSYFDKNYINALAGTQGVDMQVLHQPVAESKIGLSSMEKVTAITAAQQRKSLRTELVKLLKNQVAIESMYSTKKEKLYMQASATYSLISNLLHGACSIAIQNDGLWKEQMTCFNAYRQLLEVYTMWNGVRDVAFALEHGMSISMESLAVCGNNTVAVNRFVSHNAASGRLQNSYLVSSTMRSCYDNLQIKIESLRKWLTTLMVSMDSSQDRAESCLFRAITVLTCLTAGNQENILDLAIREEHSQRTAYSFARYAAVSLNAAENSVADDEVIEPQADTANAAALLQVGNDEEESGAAPASGEVANLREVRPHSGQ